MIALIQRVRQASVTIEGRTAARIGPGILAFIAAERDDGVQQARRLAERVVGYRVFPDESGRMSCSVVQHGGAILAVPQFTLAADTRKGMRPSFTPAAPPELGAELFGDFVEAIEALAPGRTASGVFGADMQVELINDGPVTFWLHA